MRFRFLVLAVSCLSVACLLSACNAGEVEETSSAPTESVLNTSTQWDRDAFEHWRVGVNGEKEDVGSHTFEESLWCSVCGSEVLMYEDRSVDIYNYNELGEWLRISSYDADGMLLSDNTYDYGYDNNGNILWMKQYLNGFMVEESTYAINVDGYYVPVKQMNFDLDGTRSEILFNDHGHVVEQTSFGVDGNIILKESTEYTADDNGIFYVSKETSLWEDGSKMISEYNAHNDKTAWTEYDSDGNVLHSHNMNYEYDPDGNKLKKEFYLDDVLVSVSEYALDENGVSYVARDLEILDDDGNYVVYVYNELGDIVSETVYDVNGNVVE